MRARSSLGPSVVKSPESGMPRRSLWDRPADERHSCRVLMQALQCLVEIGERRPTGARWPTWFERLARHREIVRAGMFGRSCRGSRRPQLCFDRERYGPVSTDRRGRDRPRGEDFPNSCHVQRDLGSVETFIEGSGSHSAANTLCITMIVSSSSGTVPPRNSRTASTSCVPNASAERTSSRRARAMSPPRPSSSPS